MSDPKERQPQDELELEPETVQDLEPREEDADEVRGGACTKTSSDIT